MAPDSKISPTSEGIVSSDPTLTLSPQQRRQVLVEWNQTRSPYPHDSCLHHRFEAQAAKTPDAEALVVGHERLTYRELNRRANRVAHRLRALGVGPEVLVGIFLTRCADMLCALLGVLKAGGAYVPLDPHYPADRLSFILEDAKVHTVLTHASLAGNLRDLSTTAGSVSAPSVVCMDTDPHLATSPDDNPPSSARAENLAYVIYTSGSTGRAKGVCVEHRNVVAFVQWGGELYSPRELSGVVATATLCFDASVLELFIPLSFGGKVILADNALAVPELPAANEIHLMDTVPSAIRELLRTGGLPSSLETVNLGGEPVPDDVVEGLYRLPHIKRVYDQYGPTETTVVATCALRDPRGPATIGRPISNYQAYLLNDRLEPVASGEPGELFIGGAGVTRGYLNRPELTAERFLPDPFSSEPGGRLYRTGDICRHRPDGQLAYIGRSDQQVKIRGFRIEPGEIESVLRSCPEVGEAVVRLWTDPDGAKKLVAYVVSSPGSPTPSERRLREELKSRLPDYMVPAAIVPLDRLPLGPNGKIDPKALPAPSTSRPELASSFAAPRTPLERALAAAWQRVLHVDPVGIDDSFIELGGDSLRLVALHKQITHLTTHPVLITDLFRFPTIRSLAAHLDKPALDRSSKIQARARRQTAALGGVTAPISLT